MFGPCLCGDICCPSCGPAQGNFKCSICGKWASEDDVHFDEETGDLRPEFKEEWDRKAKEEAEAEAAYYEQEKKWEEELKELERKGLV